MVDFDLSKFKTYNTDGTWNDNVYTLNDVTFTVDTTNKTITVNGTASAYTYFYIDPTQLNNMIEGHKYLMYGCPSGGSWGTYCLYLAGGYFLDVGGPTIAECTAEWLAEANKSQMIAIWNGATINNKVFHCGLRDLSVIFPEGVPSTVAECVAKCSDILKYDAFGTSMVDTTVEGVRSISRNRLKPSTFKSNLISWGGIDNGDGTVTISASQLSSKIVWENDTDSDVLSFCFTGSGSSNMIVRYTDGNYDYIQNLTSVGTWLTSDNTKRVKALEGAWITGDTVLNIAKCGIFTGSTSTWSDYDEQTLSLPTPVTLRSAGNVAEVFDLETGKKTNPLGEYTFTGSEAGQDTFGAGFIFRVSDLIGVDASALMMKEFVPINPNSIYSGTEIGFALVVPSNGTIGFYDPSKFTSKAECMAYLTGKKVYYGLVTPNADTQLTPVINNTIKTEGGGTINTIQTQTPVIDNSMDVGYLAL